MKIIDLLNKIANGEEVPIKIKFDNIIFEYDGDYYSSKTNVLLEEYCHLTTSLNDEVKIIEEEKKIPEKIPNNFHYTGEEETLANKINEILDYLKNKGE